MRVATVVTCAAAVLLGGVGVEVAPASADVPANVYSVGAGGNHDWIPASGAASSSGASPVTISGTMTDLHGAAAYVTQAGPGVVRARQVGGFRNPSGFTLRFDPGLSATAQDHLTVSGPGTQVDASLNIHVDGEITADCPGFTYCSITLDVRAGLNGHIAETIVSLDGMGGNALGLEVDPIEGGFHVHGDVQTPVTSVAIDTPTDTFLSITLLAGNLGSGLDAHSRFDAQLDELSFAPTGPVLNLPPGYTVSGDSVVDNSWTDALTAPASIVGTVVDDLDDDGVHDLSEPTMAGITVFIDSDASGTLDPGERASVTDVIGRYTFLGLAPGVHTVDFDLAGLPAGYSNTGAKPLAVSLAPGQDVGGQDFFVEHATPSLVADYRFADTYASSVGTPPDLADLGSDTNTFTDAEVDGVDQRVLTFPVNNGLVLDPATGAIPSDRYTIVMLVNLDPVDGDIAKLLDFKGGTLDSVFDGLYVVSGSLYFLGGGGCVNGASTPVTPGEWTQIGLSRDSDGIVRGTVDGIEQFRCPDTNGHITIGTQDTLQLFRGADFDFQTSGSVARVRLYGDAMTAAELAGLDRTAPPAPDPVEALGALLQAVEDASIHVGIRDRLLVKLNGALSSLTRPVPNVDRACRKLDNFVATIQADAAKTPPRIDTATAGDWTEAARDIQGTLGC